MSLGSLLVLLGIVLAVLAIFVPHALLLPIAVVAVGVGVLVGATPLAR